MSHPKPFTFYAGEVEAHSLALKAQKKKVLTLALLRLFSFLLTVLGIYLTIDMGSLPILIGVVGTAAFLFFVSKHADYQAEKKRIAYLTQVNQEEKDRLRGHFKPDDDGSDFVDDTHAFASDIDLFGQGSFFQLINRTELPESRQRLADLLKGNEIEDIPQKQAAVKELAVLPKWRHRYKVLAHFVQAEIPRHVVVNWMKTYQAFMPKSIYVLTRIFPFVSGLVLTLYLLGILPLSGLLIVFFSGLVLTGRYVKKINKLSIHVGQLKMAFSNYAKLIAQIEATEFTSDLCCAEQARIKSETQRASNVLKTFSKHLSALDQRNNILFAIIGNGFLLWDCHQTYKIENWILSNGRLVEDWFETIEFFDAMNSLGAFAFNRPSYQYPSIDENANSVLDVKQLGHMMIDPQKRVDNDFLIDQRNFKIITGANMAGKSTFLRTVALSIVSANIGLPICCESAVYRPIKLITSMRNTDSLQDDSSYFFSELVRLKFIVDAIKTAPYFIILDEILKGTNSKDKEEGSKQLMKKLSRSDSSGIIATHDLGLCEIANTIPSIQNQYFDAEIINDELSFDYTLKAGICQNMNASFLLTKMEIV